MIKLQSVIIVALVAFTVPLLAEARSVYLNGVDISDVRDQTFKKVTVTIDKRGNIRIDAPGYKVQVVDPADKNGPRAEKDDGGPNPSLEKRYYLVTQPSPQGRAQYDFAVLINGVEKRRIPAGSKQVIMEISAWLHKGENNIVLKAFKNTSQGKKSSSSSDEARIMIGEGHEEGKTVKIDLIRLSLKVNASKTSDTDKHLVLIAK